MSRPYMSSSQAWISSRVRSTRGEPGWVILSTIVTTASGPYIDSWVAASRSSAACVKRSRSKLVMVLMASSLLSVLVPRAMWSAPSRGRPSTRRQTSVKTRGRLCAVLRARLLGALEVELNGAVIDSPVSQRPWAVFAYLALAPRPVARTELASRFWPDVLDQSARASLRSALWTLRRQMGDALEVDGERVGLGRRCGAVDRRARVRAAGRAAIRRRARAVPRRSARGSSRTTGRWRLATATASG